MNASMILKPIITMFLPMLIKQVSPAFREVLTTSALALYAKAKATPNPYDDMVAGLVCAIAGIPTE